MIKRRRIPLAQLMKELSEQLAEADDAIANAAGDRQILARMARLNSSLGALAVELAFMQPSAEEAARQSDKLAGVTARQQKLLRHAAELKPRGDMLNAQALLLRRSSAVVTELLQRERGLPSAQNEAERLELARIEALLVALKQVAAVESKSGLSQAVQGMNVATAELNRLATRKKRYSIAENRLAIEKFGDTGRAAGQLFVVTSEWIGATFGRDAYFSQAINDLGRAAAYPDPTKSSKKSSLAKAGAGGKQVATPGDESTDNAAADETADEMAGDVADSSAAEETAGDEQPVAAAGQQTVAAFIAQHGKTTVLVLKTVALDNERLEQIQSKIQALTDSKIAAHETADGFTRIVVRFSGNVPEIARRIDFGTVKSIKLSERLIELTL